MFYYKVSQISLLRACRGGWFHRKVQGRYSSESDFIIELYLDRGVLEGTSLSSPIC